MAQMDIRSAGIKTSLDPEGFPLFEPRLKLGPIDHIYGVLTENIDVFHA